MDLQSLLNNVAQHLDNYANVKSFLSLKIFNKKIGWVKLELFTWDFPSPMACPTVANWLLCLWLTQCLWNSLQREGIHSTGASVWWHLRHGARHLLFWFGLNLNLCCLTGFCISEGIFLNHKLPALLSCMHGCWEGEFNLFLLLKI